MLGDVIRGLREKRGYTQEVAAKKLGIPRSTYSNYELGKREPDLKTIKEIAEFYSVNITDLAEVNNEFEVDINISSVDDIIEKYNLMVDGKPMTRDEAKSFLSFLRMNRSLD